MTFEEMLQQTIEILRNRGRMSYRALKRQFDIDDAYLEDLKEEILYAYPQVTEEEGRGLVWTAADTTMSVPTPVPVHPAQATATPERSATKEPSPTAAPSAPEAERRQRITDCGDREEDEDARGKENRDAVEKPPNDVGNHLPPSLCERFVPPRGEPRGGTGAITGCSVY